MRVGVLVVAAIANTVDTSKSLQAIDVGEGGVDGRVEEILAGDGDVFGVIVANKAEHLQRGDSINVPVALAKKLVTWFKLLT